MMKLQTITSVGAAALWLTSTALADKYDDLVTKGYRWVTTDGPFACASKDDVNRIIKNQNDANTLHMVEQGDVYFLIRGAIVQVVEEDKASGMSQVHWDGITTNLWTPSRFLSKRPVLNILGTIATPTQGIGVNRSDIDTRLDVSPTPSPFGASTRGEAAEPGAGPTP